MSGSASAELAIAYPNPHPYRCVDHREIQRDLDRLAAARQPSNHSKIVEEIAASVIKIPYEGHAAVEGAGAGGRRPGPARLVIYINWNTRPRICVNLCKMCSTFWPK